MFYCRKRLKLTILPKYHNEYFDFIDGAGDKDNSTHATNTPKDALVVLENVADKGSVSEKSDKEDCETDESDNVPPTVEEDCESEATVRIQSRQTRYLA